MPKKAKNQYYTVTATLPNGRRKYYRGKTKKEAEKKRDAESLDIEMGVNVDDKITVSELTKLWLKIRIEGGLHERSIETIKGILDRYILPTLGKQMVREVLPYHIRFLMSKMSRYSQSTQRKVIQYTRSIFELAVENRIIGRNPCVRTIKAGGTKPKEIEPLTDEQCDILLSATKGTRVWLFIVLLLYTGMRKGEALGLMWKDIDFKKDTIKISRSIVYLNENKDGIINNECKTKASHRTVPMITTLSDALKAEKKKSKSQYVFSMQNGSYLSEHSFRSMWRLIDDRSVKTKRAASINDRPIDFEVHPHLLRHTFATRLIRNGMEPKQVMYLLGHSTMNVTMEIYIHYQEELRRKEAQEKIAKAWNA